jgi:AcrR family transcriptional regulator
MAKPGVRSRPSSAGSDRSADTKRALVAAAIEVLKSEGYGGASARAIAEKADCNQALIFYHFGTVVDLLLAALDEVSTTRLTRYRAALAQVHTPTELVDAATGIFSEDLDAGHAAVLVEMIAGASSTPGLGEKVAERIEPWKRFAADAVANTLGKGALAPLAPADEAAHAIVALYLGLEMLAHLDGDRGPAMSLFERARSMAGLLSHSGLTAAPETRRGQRP